MTKDTKEIALLVEPPTKWYLIKAKLFLLVSSLFFVFVALMSLSFISVAFIWPQSITETIFGTLFIVAQFLYIIPGILGILVILIQHKIVTYMYVISVMLVSVLYLLIFLVYMSAAATLGFGVFSLAFLIVAGCCSCQIILGNEFNGIIFEMKIMNSN